MKRVLTLIIALAMLCSLVIGCGGNQEVPPAADSAPPSGAPADETASDAPAPSDSAPAELPHHKLGFICWGYTGSLEMQYKATMEKLGEALNFEVMFAEGGTNEDILAAVENLAENGCEGILATTAPPTVMELCDSLGIYFVQYSNNVDEETKAQFEKSDYWVGYIGDNDELAGYNGMKALVEQGCKEIGLISFPAGMQANHDNRYAGMIKAAEELGVTYHEYRGLDVASAVQNFCTIYPELDGIFATAGSSGLADAFIQTIETCGMGGQVKVATIDIVDNIDVYLSEGSYAFAAGGQYPDVELCVAMLLNALNGERLGGGPVYAFSNMIEIASLEDWELYTNYINGDVLPYTPEEIMDLLTIVNPDASAQDIINYAENFSLETVVQRHAGLVD